MVTPVLARLLSHVDYDPSGCWTFNGARVKGYGSINVAGVGRLAHRVAYETLVGPIPKGLQLDHLCRNPPCVNPAHLEPVTGLENIRRGHGHGSETHCPQGHPYDEANTYIGSYPKAGRICRTCRRERMRLVPRPVYETTCRICGFAYLTGCYDAHALVEPHPEAVRERRRAKDRARYSERRGF